MLPEPIYLILFFLTVILIPIAAGIRAGRLIAALKSGETPGPGPVWSLFGLFMLYVVLTGVRHIHDRTELRTELRDEYESKIMVLESDIGALRTLLDEKIEFQTKTKEEGE